MKEQTALQKIDPQALITKALESGANIEVLERLVSLSERVRETSAKEAFQTAFVNFQAECPPIKKNKVARIQGRSGGSYSYKYADLDEIVQTISPVMQKYGLSWSWSAPRTDTTHAYVACTIAHVHGHKESSGEVAMPIGGSDSGANPAQRVGIALTYARRYSLTGILGIAPEDDTDAHGSEADRANGFTKPPAPPVEPAPLFDSTELDLAKKALRDLMDNPRFSEAQREVAAEWLAKPANQDVKKIKAKMRAQSVWLEDVQAPQNPDADVPAEGQAF